MKAFNEIDWYSYKDHRQRTMINEIERLTKDYILKVNEEEYFEYLKSKYWIEPLTIDRESEQYGEPQKGFESRQSMYRGEQYQVETFRFHIFYNYTGSPDIFKISPTRKTLTGADITIHENTNQVSFTFSMEKQDPEAFFKTKDSIFNRAFTNLHNANDNVDAWNSSYFKSVPQLFKVRKEKFIGENSFFEAIKLKTNKNTNQVFSAPTVKRRIVPQPKKDNTKEYTFEPAMNSSVYEDILNIVYESGKSMEKKPSLYKNKDEEGLRDQFLFILETRYEGTTASGETFNRNGKTDILLKYQDGSNLFVAECKFWKGEVSMKDAIHQLFDRYLTWRDSKTALIFFVTQKDITKINSKVDDCARTHPYFVSTNGTRGESSKSYKFKFPQDESKTVFLEIMTFHYDEIR